MPNGRPTIPSLILALVGLMSGCAQPGMMISRRTTVGALKASVAQLERDKVQLAKKLADLEAENRRVADRLLQEQEANTRLAHRLDDAETLLGRRGQDAGQIASPSYPSEPEWEDEPRPSRTTPAGDTGRPRRKVPFAQIGGPIEVRPYPEERSRDTYDDFPEPPASSFDRDGYEDNPYPQSRNDRPTQWLPIASGVSESPRN